MWRWCHSPRPLIHRSPCVIESHWPALWVRELRALSLHGTMVKVTKL